MSLTETKLVVPVGVPSAGRQEVETLANQIHILEGWQDNVAHFSTAKGRGTSEPVWADTGNGMYAMRFDTNDELFVMYHVTHDYKPNSKAYLHVHFLVDSAMAPGQEVNWRIKYVQAKGYNQGESLTAPTTTIDLQYIATGAEVSGEHIIVECSEAQAFVLAEVDTLVQSSCELLPSTVSGNVFGLMMDMHYEVDTLTTINKNFPFYS